MTKNTLDRLSLLCLFCVCFFISLYYTPNPFFNCYNYNWDTSIYQYIGSRMWHGELPYRDIFDHKGPIIYFWNMLGYGINPIYGQWLIELSILYSSALIALKIASRFVSSFWATLLIIAVFQTVKINDTIGNTESLAVFLQFYLLDKLIIQKNKIQYFQAGIASGTLLFIKPTYCIGIAILYLGLFIKNMQEKQYKEIKKLISQTFYGFFLVVALIMSWLIYHHLLDNFWQDYIIFNIEYINYQQKQNSLYNAFCFYLRSPIIYCSLISALLFLLSWRRNGKQEHFIFGLSTLAFLSLLTTLLLSPTQFDHNIYIVYPYAFMLLLNMTQRLNRFPKFLTMVLLCLWGLSLYHCYLVVYQRSITRHRPLVAGIINRYLADDEKFQVIGFDFAKLHHITNHSCATKYPYTDMIANISPQNFYDELRNALPPIIVFTSQQENSYLTQFNSYWPEFSHKYHKFYQDNHYILYGTEEMLNRWHEK